MASELTEVLTDKDIDDLLTDNQKNGDAYATAYEVRELCAELRTRRTREKALVEALKEAIDIATDLNGDDGDDDELHRRRDQIAQLRTILETK